jgi:hypothetical protein
LISPDFIRVRCSGADDAYDFFAIVILPVHVLNDEDCASQFAARTPQCMPAPLACFIDAVGQDPAIGVSKDQRREFE